MMKNLLLVLFLLVTCCVFSQNCQNYFFLQNHKTIEMTLYNKKGEPNGKQVYSVSNVTTSGNNVTATLNSELFDKSGKSVVKAVNQLKCNGGVMMMDMKMNMPQIQSSATDATASNVYIEYPPNMKEGDMLKDATMQMDMDNRGVKQTVDMQVINRKVLGKESVTTPAGTWECYKITNTTKMKIKTMGIGVPVNSDVTEWFAPGFGVVKSETKSGGTAITAIL